MPKQKKLSYRKCGRCRRDRQKCLPENRLESTRCNRCIHYDYVCSPNKTMAEENMATAGKSLVPDKTLKSTKQCLQEMGDLRCLLETSYRFRARFFSVEETSALLRARLYSVIDESRERAERFQNEGNWGEADILFRRIMQKTLNSAELVPKTWDPFKPTLRVLEGPVMGRQWSPEAFRLHIRAAVIYENVGDFALAEETYEFLLKRDCFGEISTVTSNLVRLYELFWKRAADMDIWNDSLIPSQKSLSFLYTFYRVSVLDSEILSSTLLHSSAVPQTWLLSASTAGTSKIVQQFLDNNIAFDLEAEDVDKCTALHRVVGRGWIDIARTLLEKGAKANCRNRWLKTPLHVAIQNGIMSIIPLLLDFGADMNAKNYSGRTPQSYATPEVSQYLEHLFLSRGYISSSHSRAINNAEINVGFVLPSGPESFISTSILDQDIAIVLERSGHYPVQSGFYTNRTPWTS